MAYRNYAGQATRGIADKDTTCTAAAVALPNAANLVNTNSLDLGAVLPFPLTEKIQVKVVTVAGTAANSKNINFWLTDSADDTTFTNIANIGVPLYTLAAVNTSYPATTFVASLPPITKRYIRLSCIGEANGGNAGDTGTVTLSLLF